MAVNSVAQSTTLVIKIQKGTNATGAPIYVNRSYTNVKPGTTNDVIYAVGQELGALQKYPPVSIERRDLNALVSA